MGGRSGDVRSAISWRWWRGRGQTTQGNAGRSPRREERLAGVAHGHWRRPSLIVSPGRAIERSAAQRRRWQRPVASPPLFKCARTAGGAAKDVRQPDSPGRTRAGPGKSLSAAAKSAAALGAGGRLPASPLCCASLQQCTKTEHGAAQPLHSHPAVQLGTQHSEAHSSTAAATLRPLGMLLEALHRRAYATAAAPWPHCI